MNRNLGLALSAWAYADTVAAKDPAKGRPQGGSKTEARPVSFRDKTHDRRGRETDFQDGKNPTDARGWIAGPFLRGNGGPRRRVSRALPGGLHARRAQRPSTARSTCLPGTSSPTTNRRWLNAWTAEGNPAVDLAVIPNVGYSGGDPDAIFAAGRRQSISNYKLRLTKHGRSSDETRVWAATLQRPAGSRRSDRRHVRERRGCAPRVIPRRRHHVVCPIFSGGPTRCHYNAQFLARCRGCFLGAGHRWPRSYDASVKLRDCGHRRFRLRRLLA